MTTLSDLIDQDIRSIVVTATLREAAVELTEEQVSALVVPHDDRVIGVVTEHDIVRAVAEGVDPDMERVSDQMSDHVVTLEADREVEEAAALMREHRIRHVVVTNDGMPVGVVSIRAVAAALSRTPA